MDKHVDPFTSLATSFMSVVAASDAAYTGNDRAPTPTSTALLEVAEHDEALTTATGTERPLFGAYANAEAKLRSLNDLVRSFSVLLARTDANVGQVVVARAAIETAAFMWWGLAIDGDYRDRAARWLRELLRTIEEVSKFDPVARAEMQPHFRQIVDGGKNAGLSVTGPSPAAIDLVWPLVSAASSPVRIDGLDRQSAMLLCYRSPSGPMHGAPHGTFPHFEDPALDVSRRSTSAAPPEQSLLLMAAVLNGYANAHGALTTLYGWNASAFNRVAATTAQQLSAALQALRA